MIYMYWISLGLASLHKMDANGTDKEEKPKKIGKFKTDAEAKQACIDHHDKACKMAKAAGREEPQIKFF